VPKDFKRPKLANLRTARTFDLVAALAQPNGWQRDTAARLLFERQDPADIPLLSSMVSNSVVAFARVQAAYTLTWLGGLNEGHVLKLLQETNAYVRQNAVLLSEYVMPNGIVPPILWDQLKTLATDPSPRVRLQLAFTAGVARRLDRIPLWGQMLARDITNVTLQTAVLSSLGEGAGPMFQLLANDNGFRNDRNGMQFLQRLADMIGTRGNVEDVHLAIQFLSRAPLQIMEAYRLTAALGDGLRRTRSSLSLVDPNGALANIYAAAFSGATDGTVAELVRIEALRMLMVSPYTFADTSDWLLLMCNPHPLNNLRAAAIDALGTYDDPRIIPAFLESWAGFSPPFRRQAVMAMLARNTRVQFVLSAIQRGSIPKADLPSDAMNLLRAYPDPIISGPARHSLGPIAIRRPDLMDQFKTSLNLKGAADRGHDLFVNRCAGCHQVGGATQMLGPDLLTARTQPKQHLLSAILEPNAQITPGYETYVLESQDCEIVLGLKTKESHVSVVMFKPNGVSSVWPKLNIRSLRQETWSMMPDGLEQGMSAQDMADLLEFLTSGTK